MRGSEWAVLFDVDGTMVDNRAYHERAWIELGRRHGIAISSETYRASIHSRPNALNVRFLLGADVEPGFAEALAEEKEAIYRELYGPVMREIPGLTALLDALAAGGTPCAVVSNSGTANVEMVLEGLGIRDRFRVVLDITRVSRGKPDPEPLLAAASALALDPGACVLLEDSVSGFVAAEAAGVPYVVISAGADPEELGRARGARAVHRDFTTIGVEELRSYAGPAAARSGPRPRPRRDGTGAAARSRSRGTGPSARGPRPGPR